MGDGYISSWKTVNTDELAINGGDLGIGIGGPVGVGVEDMLLTIHDFDPSDGNVWIFQVKVVVTEA